MIARLPPWVEVGGFVLAFNAGMVNVVGLLGWSRQTVSNLTGAASQLGVAVIALDAPGLLRLLAIGAGFLFGAVLSRLLIGHVSLRLGRRYGVTLVLIAWLLVAAWLTLRMGHWVGYVLAAAACGLQNGMATLFSGAIVRTTHVTGIVTDIGTLIGSALLGRPVHRRRLALYLLVLGGFVLGGVAGAWGFARWRFDTLAAPVLLIVACAVAYVVHVHRSRMASMP